MKLLTSLTICVFCLLLAANDASACLCRPGSVKQTVKRLRQESDAIFTGTVKDATLEFDEEGFPSWRITVAVKDSWKPTQMDEVIFYSNGGCKIGFDTGNVVLVYAK